jgi:hypothetical protein
LISGELLEASTTVEERSVEVEDYSLNIRSSLQLWESDLNGRVDR